MWSESSRWFIPEHRTTYLAWTYSCDANIFCTAYIHMQYKCTILLGGTSYCNMLLHATFAHGSIIIWIYHYLFVDFLIIEKFMWQQMPLWNMPRAAMAYPSTVAVNLISTNCCLICHRPPSPTSPCQQRFVTLVAVFACRLLIIFRQHIDATAIVGMFKRTVQIKLQQQ